MHGEKKWKNLKSLREQKNSSLLIQQFYIKKENSKKIEKYFIEIKKKEICICKTTYIETMNNICVRLTANQDEVCRHLANSGGCLEQNYKVVTRKIFDYCLMFNLYS